MNHRSRLLMTTCALAALAALSGQAHAQGAAQPAGGASTAEAADSGTGSTLGEVVVTANKREENLQDVSASVAVVSQAAVERQGVKEFIDLTRVNPDVRVNTGIYTNITIRGVRTSNFGPTVDQPNAIHLDGVYISRSTALNGLFFDTERVEVLAGPQGTLYGRNSAGGTINIITVRPRLGDYGGRASLEYGNYNTLTVNAAINLPIGDKFAVRAAFWRNRHDGYNDNGTDDANQEAARVSLFWRPTDNDTFFATMDKSYNRPRNVGPQKIRNVIKNPSIATSGCAGGVYACLVAAGTPGSVVVPIPTGGPDGRDIRAFAGDQDLQGVNTNSGGLMGQYDHDFRWANLTVQAAYRDTFSNNTVGTSTGFNVDPRLITTTVITPANWGGNILKTRWNTQEIRLTSPGNRPFTWVGGLYRFDEHTFDPKSGNYAYFRTFPNTSAATLGQVQYAMPLRIGNDASNTLNDTIAYAAFGQATYTFAEKLHLTGGLRYNDEKKHGIGFSLQNGVINPRTVFDDRRQWKAWTYKLNAAYDITPQNMVYVDHSTGFKSGGFAFGSTPAYEPEKIKAYEIGTKNRFLNGRLTVNGSAWWYDYTNIVQTVFEFYFDNVLGRPNGFLNTTNGKKAKLSGQSITADWQVTGHDILSVNATHIKARFKEYSTLPLQQFGLSNGFFPGATAATFDYAGSPFPSVPKWAWNVSYDHIFDVLGGELDVQVAARYTGARLATNNSVSLNDPNAFNWVYTGGQTTFDASARYSPGNGRWAVTGYIRNIGNEDVIYNRAYTTNSTQYLNPSDPRVFYAYQTENYYAPRTFGVIVSANF